jgi:hypothetical protein
MCLQDFPPQHLLPPNISPQPGLPAFGRPAGDFKIEVEEISDKTQKAFAWGGVHDWHQRLHDLKTRSFSRWSVASVIFGRKAIRSVQKQDRSVCEREKGMPAKGKFAWNRADA